MKQFALSLLLVWPLILGFFQRSADASTTDYALMSATPYYSEIALARGRLEKFLYKANAKNEPFWRRLQSWRFRRPSYQPLKPVPFGAG
jgi:hypothetical protein